MNADTETDRATAEGVPASLDELAGSLRRLAAELAVRLDAAQRGEAAAELRAQSHRQATRRPTVVVAGECKRGKSSLVNALVGHPGASPVDADVATGCPVVFEYGPAPLARVNRGSGAPAAEIPIEELGDWATLAGNPGNHRGVRWVEVQLPSPLLRELRLIDTPGVGGLESGHAELTLEALTQADALLFVVDAGAPLTSPELQFLRRAAERLDTVVLTLTKTDLYRGWETVARDDAALLAKNAPRFAGCELVPVSSLLAERAVRLGPGPDSRALRREAGLHRVEALLMTQVVRRAGLLQLANGARLCGSATDWLSAVQARQLAAASGNPELAAAFEAEQRRLRELSRGSAEWRYTLDAAIRRLTLQRSDEMRESIGQLQRRYTERVLTTRGDELDALPGQVFAEIAALASQLSRRTAAQLDDLAASLLEGVEAGPALSEAVARVAGAGLGESDVVPLIASRTADTTDRLAVLTSFSSGRGLLTGFSGLGVGIAAGPLGVLAVGVGVAFAFLMARGRGDQVKRVDFRTWLREQSVEAQSRMNADFARHLVDVQDELRRAVTARIEQRQDEVAGTLDALRRSIAEDNATRQRRRAEAQQALAGLGALRQRAHAIHQQLVSQEAPPPAARAGV